MRVSGGELLITAGDVAESTACTHRTVTAFRLAHGLPVTGQPAPLPPGTPEPGAAVMAAGVEHEAAVVAAMHAQGLRIVDLSGTTPDLAAWSALAQTTLDHLRTGDAQVVLQGAVLHRRGDGTTFVGRPDFLVRTDAGWRVEDAKLARSLSPSALLQTMLYRDALCAAGVGVHDEVRLHLGTGEVHEVAARTGAAWARRQAADLSALLADLPARGALEQGYAAPAQWCSVCEDDSPCGAARARADHLGAVADLRRDQARRLEAAGITTVAALAAAPGPVPGMPAPTFEGLREQADLQVRARSSGTVPVKIREHPRTLRSTDVRPGLWLVPGPSAGDVFFDMEGDPLWTTPGSGDVPGLEYLFGATHDGEEFTPFWAHDRAQERRAFEAFVDWVQARRERWPDLRVYHYAAYEKTALARLAAQHGTRAAVVDEWLRSGLMVDLYQAVRRGIRAGVTSYSIKKIEKLYGMDHTGQGVETAMGSVEQYEVWRTTGEQGVLDAIEEYNRYDCDSTRELRGYLLRLRDAAVEAGTLTAPVVEEVPAPEEAGEPSEKALLREDLEAAGEVLLAGADLGVAGRDPAREARRVLAGLLGYHVREEKAAWRDVFRVAERVAAEGPPAAVADAAVLGGLELAEASTTARGAPLWTFTAPVQEHRVEAGGVLACVAGAPVSARVVSLEPVEDELVVTLTMSSSALERGGWSAGSPPPVDALMASAGVSAEALQRSLLALAELVGPPVDGATVGAAPADPLLDPRGARAAARALLLRRASLAVDVLPPAHLDEDPVAHAVRLARGDTPAGDGLVIAVQGPPGAGKSYLGSQVVDALVADARAGGRSPRIGVTANSHAVVQHLLKAVHRRTPGAVVRHKGGTRKGKDPATWERLCDDEGCARPLLMTNNLDGWTGGEVLGGTAWAFSPEGSPPLDVLVVDEAGQMGLGDVLAASRNARTVLLLGDPQQLAKPSRAAHPPGVAVSALEHLMRGQAVMPRTSGIFLGKTWRMHEDVSGFISDIAYQGELESAPVCADRAVLPVTGGTGDPGPDPYAGTGLRWVPVVHEGNAQGSDEECAAVVGVVRELLARAWTAGGEEEPIGPSDVLVVSPYNAQVRRLRSALTEAGLGDVPVGTVDKFQGQEGVAVVYSTASSDADEAPRGLEFLYDTHRLNVAVSRARCLAFWVGSPQLVRPRVTGAEQVPMVDAHCAFVERATDVSPR